MPVGAVELTVIFMVEVPAPAIDVGVKLTVTPVGWPDAAKAIVELKPPVTELLMVDVPLPPCATEAEVGEADRLKSADVASAVSALTSVGVGLPQPVTRS